MKAFAIYDTTTGMVLQIAGADDIAQVEDALADGQGVLEDPTGEVTDSSHYVDPDGDFVPYPTPRPDFMTWDRDNSEWYDARSDEAVAQAEADSLKVEMRTSETAHNQDRSVREVLLALIDGTTPPADAVQNLRDIDATNVALRAQLDALDI
jgi:hypothetical protein